MFDIITSRDLLAKLEADYADFKAQPDSARHALNFIITAYHLHEWVWGEWLKSDHATWKRLGIRDYGSFKQWLAGNWTGFGVVESLTNGAKHFIRETSNDTKRVAGYGCGPYDIGPYGKPYLLIDHGAAAADRWQTAEQLIDNTAAFWRSFFETHRPPPSPVA